MYYITLCVNHRLCLFGDVINGEMRLNDAGLMVDKAWKDIHENYPGVDTDEHVVMTNHLHGIIILNHNAVGAPPCGRPMVDTKNRKPANQKQGQAQGPAPTVKRLFLGDVVGRFETFTMHEYILGVKNHNWVRFEKKLWQRNYYACPDFVSGNTS